MQRRALEIDERLGRLDGMANDYRGLGNVLETRGIDGCGEAYREALEIDERLGRLAGMAEARRNLGNVLHTRGDLDGAEQMLRKVLEIGELLGSLKLMASAYGNLGNVAFTREDLATAEQTHRKSIEINERLGRPEGMALGYSNLGNVLCVRGDLTEQSSCSAERWRFTNAWAASTGWRLLTSTSDASWARGDLDQAEQMQRKALEIVEHHGGLERMAVSYENLSEVFRRRGDLDGAEQMQHKVMEINDRLGRLEGIAYSHMAFGTIRDARGDTEGACREWRSALGLFQTLGLERMALQMTAWLEASEHRTETTFDSGQALRPPGANRRIRHEPRGSRIREPLASSSRRAVPPPTYPGNPALRLFRLRRRLPDSGACPKLYWKVRCAALALNLRSVS